MIEDRLKRIEKMVYELFRVVCKEESKYAKAEESKFDDIEEKLQEILDKCA